MSKQLNAFDRGYLAGLNGDASGGPRSARRDVHPRWEEGWYAGRYEALKRKEKAKQAEQNDDTETPPARHG